MPPRKPRKLTDRPNHARGHPPREVAVLKRRIEELDVINELLIEERDELRKALNRAINALGLILLRADADPVGADAARYALRDLLDLL